MKLLSVRDATAAANRKIVEIEKEVAERQEWTSRSPLPSDWELHDKLTRIRHHLIGAMVVAEDQFGKEPWYFSKGGSLPGLNVCGWEQKRARLYYIARERLLTKRDLEQPSGGPIGRWKLNDPEQKEYEVAIYQIGDLQLEARKATGAKLAPSIEAITEGPGEVEATREAQRLGLGEVTFKMSLLQWETAVETPLNPLVITGPPGSGKTSVAMDRLRFLLNLHTSDDRQEMLKELRSKFGKLIAFKVQDMAVLVRRKHLEGYLSDWCQTNMVSPAVVRFLDHFLMNLARGVAGPQVTFSRKDGPEVPLKQSIPFDDFLSYAATLQASEESPLSNEERGVFVELLTLINSTLSTEKIRLTTREAGGLEDLAEILRRAMNDRSPLAAMERVVELLRAVLNRTSREYNFGARYDDMISLRDKLLPRADRAVQRRRPRNRSPFQELMRFYLSERIAGTLIETTQRRLWEEAVRGQRDAKLLYGADHLNILAMTEALLKAGIPITAEPPRFSHIILDEAQLMPPLLLRLIADCWTGSMRSCTFVGDPAQRLDDQGTEDFATLLRNASHVHLREVYRPTQQTYEFLRVFGKLTGIEEELQPGKTLLKGPEPLIVRAAGSDAAEVKQVAELVGQWHESDPFARIVMVPVDIQDGEEAESVVGALEDALYTAGIPIENRMFRDLQTNATEPTITDIDSLIGLEFDYVILFRLGGAANKQLTAEELGGLWIGLSRPTKQLCVLDNGLSDSIFADPAFEQWRADPTASATVEI